jgi:hypothetical protein
MVVNNIFPKIKYPNDRNSIEHIIKEYDRKLEHLLNINNSNKFGKYCAYALCLGIELYILKCSYVSVFIRCLYIMPVIAWVLYHIYIYCSIKNDYSNRKIHYKLKLFNIVFICIFLYSGTFMFESILFGGKWVDCDYLICFCILMILCSLSFVIARINAPKKFIGDFQYKENKLYTPSSILIGVISLSVCIAYFNKPYYLLLIIAYIAILIMFGLSTYIYFVYEQYDKIQELKKEINYIPKERKK